VLGQQSAPTHAPPAFRPASSATPVPASALVPQPNPFLGYSINVPPGYRRAASVVESAATGHDIYTSRTAQQDSDLCRQEQQKGSDSPERISDFKVGVYANPSGASPVDFANAPNRRIAFTTIEPTTVAGDPAARVVHQPSGDTAYYACQRHRP